MITQRLFDKRYKGKVKSKDEDSEFKKGDFVIFENKRFEIFWVTGFQCGLRSPDGGEYVYAQTYELKRMN